MAVETGNQIQVAYIAEATFGTTPATPVGQAVRFTGFSLSADRSYLKNPELRTDRQNAVGRGGVLVGKGDLSGVLSGGTYDAFFEAALMGTWTTNVLKVGTTRKSFTFERLHKVNTLAFPFKGVVVDSFELTGKADANVEVKFGLLAAVCGDEAAATIWSSTTAATATAPLTTWDGSIKKGGTTIGTVTSWTLKGANDYAQAKVCGSKSLYDLAAGSIDVTGTLELLFDSNALYTDFRSENALVLQFNIGTGSGSYTIDLSNVRITKFGAPTTADGLVSVSCEFEAFADATNTAVKITRVP